jgi:hydroxymethylglutaryl-CoA lyase
MDYPQQVTLFEVGPRDGLQNEQSFVNTDNKITFIHLLNHTGLKNIEVTSFVSRDFIPQLADNEELFKNIEKIPEINYWALVPNVIGMQNALGAGVKAVAVFTAVSETFNQHNINCSIDESLTRIADILALAKTNKIRVRAYISCILGCPYEGKIAPAKVAKLTQRLLDLGIDEISLGDTIGVGTPKQTQLVLDAVLKIINTNQLAMHFHDTYGQAIANIYTSLGYGVHSFDSSVAGLGGCPYAIGATGNVATEDVLYLLQGLGIHTGVDINKVAACGDIICKLLGKKNQSKVANALLAPRSQ